MRRSATSWLPALGVVCLAPSAEAVMIGPRTYNDNAFADAVGAVSDPAGIFLSATRTADGTVFDPAFDASKATGSDVSTWVVCRDEPSGSGDVCSIELLFTDNAVKNIPGPDLTIFENGTFEVFDLTIGTTTTTITSATVPGLTSVFGLAVNAVDIELGDFGIPLAGSIDSITLTLPDLGGGGSADISAVGAIPEPSTALLLGLGLAAVGFRRHRPARPENGAPPRMRPPKSSIPPTTRAA